MKHRFHYFYFLPCLLFISSTACKKFVSIPPPSTEAQTRYIFENDQAAIAASVGLYAQMMQSSLGISNGGATVYPALSADELYNTAANTEYDAYRSNEVTTSGTGLNRLWQFSYKQIYHANAVLEGLERSVLLTDSLKKQLTGEMLVARALHYFMLVNLFGDAPLVTSTSFEVNQSLPRTAVREVYQQVIEDLLQAKQLLKDNYPSVGRVRPNKYTAAALLARLYLYTGDWTLAEQEATAVITSGIYSLQANLATVFLSNSNEAIWQLSPVSTTINTAEGNLFIPASATTRPAFAATAQLLAAFEVNDQRKVNWLKTVTISGQSYSHPFKYKVRTGSAPYTEMNMVFRLAELYLIRAEARAQQNNVAGAVADINLIRQRAALSAMTANTPVSNVLSAIEKERRIEFMFEWGHRWMDLKRTSNAITVLGPVKGASFQSSDLLYPLPQYEIDTNPFLIQNPGY